MIGLLKRLFGGRSRLEPPDDVLSRLATDPARSTDFIAELTRSDIWILAIGQNSALPTDNLTEDALLDHVERNAKELSQLSDADGIVPFILRRESIPILPFFSSMQFAEQFIHTERWKAVMAFQTFQLRSGFITSPELADCHLVFNANSKSERQLTNHERESLSQQAANA